MSVDSSKRLSPAAVLDPSFALPADAELDLFSDAAQTAELGRRFADAISVWRPEVVVFSWDEPASALLAHLVSARLRVPAARLIEQSGIVQLLDGIVEGARVVVLAESFSSYTTANGAHGVTERHGGVPVVIASVLPGRGEQIASTDCLCLAEMLRAQAEGP